MSDTEDKRQEPPELPELSNEEQVFLYAYLCGTKSRFNQTRSYKEVYSDVTDKTAAVEGHKWARKPNVVAHIDYYMAALEDERLKQDVKHFIYSVLHFDETDYQDEHGRLSPKLLKENAAPGMVRGMSETLEYDKDGKVRKSKFSYRSASLETLLSILSKMEKWQSSASVNVDSGGAPVSLVFEGVEPDASSFADLKQD